MNSTLSLAWRNLLRNRRRSLMTLVAMVLGLVTVLLFGGYIRNIGYIMQSGAVATAGHFQLQQKDYFFYGSGNPAGFSIANYQRLIDTLRQDPVLAPMLTVVTPSLRFGGIAGNAAAGVSHTVFVSGVVIDDRNRMYQWNEYGLRLPRLPTSLTGTEGDAAVLGVGVARVLQLCERLKVPDCAAASPKVEQSTSTAAGAALPSDIAGLSELGAAEARTAVRDGGPPQLELLAANAHGAPNVASVKVRLAEFQGVKELDDVHVGLHLPQAQKLVFGSAPPQVTAISLQLRHTAQMPAARQRLDELLSTTLRDEPLAILDFETLNPFYGQTMSMFAAIFGFIAILIGAIVLFTVSNTMSMSVVERTAEIGTLRAIGLRRSGIRALFVCEGVILGCLGVLLGTGTALALAALVNQLDLTWVPPGRVVPVALEVRVAGEYLMLSVATVGLLVVAALSATLPATRASRLNIVDALRHV